MSGLRILLLAPQPFFTNRGTPIAVRLVLETLAAKGARIDAIVFPEGEDVAIDGVTISRVPRLPGTGGVSPGFSLKKLALDAGMMAMATRRLLSRRYDVVHAGEEAAYMALVLRRLFGRPYVYDMDSSIPQQIAEKSDPPRFVMAGLQAMERRAVRGSVGILACCRALEDIARAQAPAVPARTVEDISLLGNAAADGEAATRDAAFDGPVAMYVGNLEFYQGVGLLIEGFALAAPGAPAARLVVIGGTAAHIDEHRALAARCGVADRIVFLGPRPVERLEDYLNRATVVVSPRLKGINTPMKVYSYLASGRPLLATRLPTHTQVLDDEIALLVEPTPEGVGAGLARLFEDQSLGQRLAQAAGARVGAEFSRHAFDRKLVAFYEEIVLPALRHEPRTGAGAAEPPAPTDTLRKPQRPSRSAAWRRTKMSARSSGP